jgi:DNA-binding FadR family transcriptional regulator
MWLQARIVARLRKGPKRREELARDLQVTRHVMNKALRVLEKKGVVRRSTSSKGEPFVLTGKSLMHGNYDAAKHTASGALEAGMFNWRLVNE